MVFIVQWGELYFGPFENAALAAQWARKNVGDGRWVIRPVANEL